MAVKQGSGGFTEFGTFDYSWAAITEADEGNSITVPGHVSELAFQVAGTFGGGTFQLQGSNDGTNFSVLQDWANTDIGSTTAKVWRFSNPPKFIKPKATAGAGANVAASVHGTIV